MRVLKYKVCCLFVTLLNVVLMIFYHFDMTPKLLNLQYSCNKAHNIVFLKTQKVFAAAAEKVEMTINSSSDSWKLIAKYLPEIWRKK